MFLQLIWIFCSRWETFAAIVTLLALYYTVIWFKNPLRQIPGPKGPFLIGNSGALTPPNDGIKTLLEWGRTYGDIYKTWNILGYCVHIQNPEHIRKILVSESTNFRRPNILERFLDFNIKGRSLFEVNGKEHAMLRRLLNPSFSYGSIQNYVSIFNKAVDNLVEYWNCKIYDQNGIFEDEIQSKLVCLTLDVIGEAAFGYKFNSVTGGHSKESKATDAILRGQGNFKRRTLEFYLPFLKLLQSEEKNMIDEAKEILDDIVMTVIKERRESKMAETDAEQKKDLLQILLDMKENGTIDLKDNDILGHVRMFMLAGHETTSMAMTWILLLLAQHEDCQDKVREEVRKVLGDRDQISFQDVKDMTYLDDCIKETMRLYPPVIYINAESIAEMKIGPYRIPKGTYIGLDVACVQRNERFWSDADLFNPDRHCAKTGEKVQENDILYRFLPFSRGPRMCIGYRFAEVEMKIVLAKLLHTFRFRTSKSQTDDFHSAVALTLRPSPSPILVISKAD